MLVFVTENNRVRIIDDDGKQTKILLENNTVFQNEATMMHHTSHKNVYI